MNIHGGITSIKEKKKGKNEEKKKEPRDIIDR